MMRTTSTRPPAHPHREASSFLVRIWRETGTDGPGEGLLRIFVRDLRSGRESYLRDEELLSWMTGGIEGEGEADEAALTVR